MNVYVCDRCEKIIDRGFSASSKYTFGRPNDSDIEWCIDCVENTEDGKRLLYAVKKMQIVQDALKEIAK